MNILGRSEDVATIKIKVRSCFANYIHYKFTTNNDLKAKTPKLRIVAENKNLLPCNKSLRIFFIM